jgi:hypothetical protein
VYVATSDNPEQLADETVYVRVTIPELIAVTNPTELIVAILVLDEDQVPPGSPLELMVVVSPSQSELTPEITPALDPGVTVIEIVEDSLVPPQFDEFTV